MDEEKEALKEELKPKSHWAIAEVKQLKFGIEYSLDQIRRVLRSFDMLFYKPYPQDYRRPSDAEECLKKHSKNE